ncbi:hypothetical protein H0H93_011023, partial [Arthromyces matolae]
GSMEVEGERIFGGPNDNSEHLYSSLTIFKGSNATQFTRTLKQNDFHRFDYYASRIARLRLLPLTRRTLMPIGCESDIDPLVYESLVSFPPGLPLLPKLLSGRIMVIAEIRAESIPPSLFVLFSPVLVQLDVNIAIAYKDMEYRIAKALELLPERCPNLESLTLHVQLDRHYSPQLQSSIEKSIASLSSLRTLRITRPPLAISTVRNIGHLPKLLDFDFTLDDEISINSQNFILTIKLKTPNFELATEAIDMLQLPLKHFEMEMHPRGEPFVTLHIPSFTSFTAAFSKHCCTSTLTVFSLYLAVFKGFSNHDVSAVFGPLFALRRLTTFSVYGDFVRKLDDAWLANAAAAWRQLQNLFLAQAGDHDFIPRQKPELTLAGLIPLIRNCPDLMMIHLNVVASLVEQKLLEGVHNHKLTKLNLRRSCIQGDPFKVYQTISTMFPRLHQITIFSDEEGWKVVQEALLTSHEVLG